ncbi:MAG: PAS domain-containing sensor histidine kinase, partial [Paramuribaculum sp.]|nr:PAS domain-containing sensor histidine kinase [Paramuribaculum sp.]
AEINRMVPMLQSTIGQDIMIKVDVTDPDPIIFDIDIMLIERALVNIVKNAAESIGNKAGGEIVLRIRKSGLKIIDNGEGIADDVSSKIFTPFFSTKRPDRGLGLMLVADILRSHGATFSLYTDRSNGLTMFDINFNPSPQL